MGHVDIEKLHKIYRACTDFSTLGSLPFRFLEDAGHQETAIIIREDGIVSRPDRIEITVGELAGIEKIQARCFVPDVMDFTNKIIVEFEETYTTKKKGHDPDGNDLRTSWRDLYYGLGAFRLLKIFDYEFKDERVWKIKLFRFLMDCFENKVGIAA